MYIRLKMHIVLANRLVPISTYLATSVLCRRTLAVLPECMQSRSIGNLTSERNWCQCRSFSASATEDSSSNDEDQRDRQNDGNGNNVDSNDSRKNFGNAPKLDDRRRLRQVFKKPSVPKKKATSIDELIPGVGPIVKITDSLSSPTEKEGEETVKKSMSIVHPDLKQPAKKSREEAGFEKVHSSPVTTQTLRDVLISPRLTPAKKERKFASGWKSYKKISDPLKDVPQSGQANEELPTSSHVNLTEGSTFTSSPKQNRAEEAEAKGNNDISQSLELSDFFRPDDMETKAAESHASSDRKPVIESSTLLDQLISDQISIAEESEESVGKDGAERAGLDDAALRDLIVNLVADSDPVHESKVKEARNSSKRMPKKRIPKISELFTGDNLGIFSDGASTDDVVKPFVSCHEIEYQDLLNAPEKLKEPRNGIEEQLLIADKVWRLPVDNESTKYDEEHIGFEEHVFLDHFLDEFPQLPAVQRFMELVINGLQQNPYLSVEQKRAKIYWFKDYFSRFSDDELQVKVKEALG